MMKINGNAIQVSELWQSATLLEYLRDHMNLMGTKFGCGMGMCGACTVHIDGEPVRSCLIPVSSVEGSHVTTIEGLSGEGDELHPVQQAWIELGVPQCGYCQAGQIMSASALLSKNPKPSINDIDQSMQGNICRCGTYPRIKQAINRASEILVEDLS